MMALSAGEITAIGIGLGNITAMIKVLAVINKSGKNGNGNRGPCGLHVNLADRLTRTESAAERLRADLSTAHDEDRQSFERIFQKLEVVQVDAAITREKATAAQADVKEIVQTIERRQHGRPR
jgi:hypothetical protein